MVELRDRYGELIEERYPKIPRRVSGYENLDQLLPGSDFNVARALAGTECTCVTRSRSDAEPDPQPAASGARDHRLRRCLCRRRRRAADPRAQADAASEGFDDLLFKAVKESNAPPAGLRLFPRRRRLADRRIRRRNPGGSGRQSEGGREEVQARARSSPIRSSKSRSGSTAKSSLGATAFVPGQPVTWDGLGGQRGPPDRLGDYLRDVQALMHRHGYEAAFYGHFGDGCLHCRINFELGTEAGLANYRRFVDEAADLVVSYGGSISGEHGDGQSKAELARDHVRPRAGPGFRRVQGDLGPGRAR